MKAERVKAEFSNLEIHVGAFHEKSFSIKCNATYENEFLTIDGGKRVVRLHMRNVSNVHLEKRSIRIAAINFEITEGGQTSVASGSIRIEVGDTAEAWYKELWS